MDLRNRIGALTELGLFMQGNDAVWEQARTKAYHQNPWFLPEFIRLAVHNIVSSFLQPEQLTAWVASYGPEPRTPKNIGLVMAGNIPLVGFHDMLCLFISGHRQTIKTSSKDNVLITALVNFLHTRFPETEALIGFSDMLKGCDAYIATGSNNSSRYFEYYFGKYPNLIRRNRTSVAVLDGSERPEELSLLADDVYTYFGLGCRNVTQVYVPVGYDFVVLLDAFRKYDHLAVYNKYKNNYDYQLTLLILNKLYYMSNDSILLVEKTSPFSPISVLNYQFYSPTEGAPVPSPSDEIQCTIGHQFLPFGSSQTPALTDYADGVDTMAFLRSL